MTLLVHGLKRSGNHAVIQWLLAQGQFTFVNNLIPVGGILRGEKAMPAPLDYAKWAPAGDVCVSLEDHPPDLQPFVNLPADAREVLILRDPANLFASRIRKAARMEHPAYPAQAGPELDRVIDLWKRHAREFLFSDKTGIYFNAWFSSEAYRRDVSERLGLRFSDAGFLGVSPEGGGSSFDGPAFDGAAQRMNVLDRRSQLTAPEASLLESILNDPEIADLAPKVAQAGNA